MGGRINEKTLEGAAAPELSSVLHALFGMDHYPAYLHKWSADGIRDLERRLEDALGEARRARAEVERRDELLREYRTARAELLGDETGPAVSVLLGDRHGSRGPLRILPDPDAALLRAALDPGVLRAVESGRKTELLRLVTRESPSIVSFQLLLPAFCDTLLDESTRFSDFMATKDSEAGARSEQTFFNRRTMVLDHMGLGRLQDLIFHLVVRPLASVYYDEAGGGALDFRYGYIVGYASGADATLATTRTSLIPHTDDSEVTLNVGLGRRFSGGQLVLRGLRGSPREGFEELRVSPSPGRAVMHHGQHLHEVLPVTEGQRYAMIMWCRSGAYRGRTCPCCTLNRRERCVCGPAWN